ncbi:uncharacterized protein N7459_002620 [Penicillium hispanicum]|uniref:uncharacterized protein n=1 Tax=Penicillium hispanicum TaxID=1080232 RepID=UPI0025418ACE|nr:uncharacterized protein N7459_002620 [Penicillium hispanicum]KAJ5586855.1 hypothetical protein N7459_002620 [Penicillium hispanicum]
MVPLSTVLASNKRIPEALPRGLVAIFVGATSGIGEYTLKCFASRAHSPRVYLIGRSQSASERIMAECKTLNPDGTFHFIQADVGLIHNVDHVCQQIQDQEATVNILFMTQGSLEANFSTSEDLQLATSLHYHSRMRFMANLLPLMEKAPALRRVVSVFAGGMEGEVFPENWQARGLTTTVRRNHVSAMVTLGLERMARQAPSVSFIHEFPGLVQTPAVDNWPGGLGVVVKLVVFLAGRWLCVPREECAERHVFLATSALYPPASGSADISGVPVTDAASPMKGTTGAAGGGVYSLHYSGESGSPTSQQALADLRASGVDDQLAEHTAAGFRRITGKESM